MSDDRLAVIERKLDGLATALADGHAKADTRLAALEAGQAKTDTRLAALEAGQGDLRRHMHVLHEDLVDKIKALDPAPLIAATRRELVALIETRHEGVTRRLDPLERDFKQRSRRRQS